MAIKGSVAVNSAFTNRFFCSYGELKVVEFHRKLLFILFERIRNQGKSLSLHGMLKLRKGISVRYKSKIKYFFVLEVYDMKKAP